MMSNRKLLILGIVAVFMVILAVVQFRISNKPKAGPGKPAYLIQGLNPADIGSIVLGTGENTVTLKRDGKRFVVVEKDNYPAVVSKINGLITSCLDILTVELYTDDKANHQDLGVTEEEARSIVKFFRPDSSLIASVVIGKDREQGGAYVRLTSSNKVYVTSKVPSIKSGVMDYIDQELIKLSRDDIESVTVSYPGGDYTLSREDNRIVLENLPEGKELKGSNYNQVFNALTNLRFKDVQKKTAAEEKLNFERQYVCRLEDSTVYTVRIAQKDRKTYVSCEAWFTDKTPVTKERGVELEEELKNKEAKLLARDKAGEFSAKHRDWIYEITDYATKNLTKELSELIEDKVESDESGQASDSDNSGL